MTRVPYFPVENKDLISPKEQQQEQKWSEFSRKKIGNTETGSDVKGLKIRVQC